jgi:hypothetical protein
MVMPMDIIKFQIFKNGVMYLFDMLSIKYCNNIFSYSSCLLFQFKTVKTFILGKNVIETVWKTFILGKNVIETVWKSS